ncbi:MAG TPA: damage-control phosphatase ARMT1 family protein [Candidatus Acidoferrum sp.]|nr:damage-control phosphatase ARMT1 family protein [Candidatus Acidoferrum sp.]
MGPFAVPPAQIALADLPPAIRTSESDSFARYTFTQRVPNLLKEALALNDFPADIRRELEALHAELTGGVIRGLVEDAPDRAYWNAVSAPHIGRSWLDVPWYWGETFFYRRLLEATRYFQPGPWHGVDPFGQKKAAELVPEAAPEAAKALWRHLPVEPRARFEKLLHASLWGNRSDLSYDVAAHLGRPTGARDEEQNLLVDDTARVWEVVRTKRIRRLAVLSDNAGTELLMDLLLADHLLRQGLAAEVHLHLKPQPFFVSDAMPKDVEAALGAMDKAGEPVREPAHRLRGDIAHGRLRLDTHWHYATSLFYFQLPEDLQRVLAGMDLVIMKGDVNYRRLLGDAHWPPTMQFAEATKYFPAPLVALRTLKGEIIVGLKPGEGERLQTEDPSWLVNGQRGVVQARI